MPSFASAARPMAKSDKSAEKSAKKKAKAAKSDATAATDDGGECEVAAMPNLRDLVCAIAKPLADDKLTKKVLKLTKKAAKRKQLKLGVKEVIKAVRKDVKG